MSSTSGEPVRQWPPAFVPFEGFNIDMINSTTASDTSMQMWRVSGLIMAFVSDRNDDYLSIADGLHVIAGAASMTMSPAAKPVWGNRREAGTSRWPVPQDLAGEQNNALAMVVPKLQHPRLRAHLADMVWTNNRRIRSMADEAVSSYVQCARDLLSLAGEETGSAMFNIVQCLHRALMIDSQVRKRGQRDDALGAVFAEAYAQAVATGALASLAQFADLAIYYQIKSRAEVAEELETVARLVTAPALSMAKSQILNYAAQMYDALGRHDRKGQCLQAAADATLEMCSQVSGAGARAHWIQQALYMLRGVREVEEKRRLLRIRLKEEQEDSLDNMHGFELPLDVEAEASRYQRAVAARSLDLADLMKLLLIIQEVPTYERFMSEAQEAIRRGGLLTILSVTHVDDQGRTAKRIRPLGPEGPDEEWIKSNANQTASTSRQLFVLTRFEPLRQQINFNGDMYEEHVRAIVAASPLVPVTHWGVVSLGLLRLFQGDYRSAVHLLVPQLEPCLRHVLRAAGCDPATEYDDLTEEDATLGALLDRFRERLEGILTKGMVFEIDLLFHHKSGPALRHNVAHGRIFDAGCFSASAVYGCWFFYRLVAFPLLESWEECIAPMLRRFTGGMILNSACSTASP